MENIFIFAIIITLIWLIILSYYLYRAVSHYRRLGAGVKKDNLILILDNILGKLKENKINIEAVNDKLQLIDRDAIGHVQKIGILRFNPFADTGGDQSFILSILDGNNNGIVLTSLHNRGSTRWYAKNVRRGEGVDHQLSEEEKKAIKQVEQFKNQQKSGLDKVKVKS
jgi:hypothetical protein